MIISDTDFISSFAKIGEVDLVFEALKTKEITITRAVYDELKEVPVFEKLLPYISGGKKNKINIENVSAENISEKLGRGENESIILAKSKNAKLLMDDREAGKYAEANGVDVIDIPAFLFYCKEKKILSVSDVK